MELGTPGERYILGGENISYSNLFAMIDQVSSCHHWLARIPGKVAIVASFAEEWRARVFRGYPEITPGWTKTFLLDCAYSSAKAERNLGYTVTPLALALKRTVSWLIDRQHSRV
jgi:hypothetical protein